MPEQVCRFLYDWMNKNGAENRGVNKYFPRFSPVAHVFLCLLCSPSVYKDFLFLVYSHFQGWLFYKPCRYS